MRSPDGSGRAATVVARRTVSNRDNAIVLGAGVVGVSTAYALARRGVAVTIVDRAVGPGQGASFANGGQLNGLPKDDFRYQLEEAERATPPASQATASVIKAANDGQAPAPVPPRQQPASAKSGNPW